jgi:hypothetical protein
MNILGLPVYKPRGYSISEYDKSTGILRPATIPPQVAAKLPIQRQPRFQLPEVNLGGFDTKMELLREKLKKDPYYNKQPQLIKLPKDTRISASDLLKKGETLYNLYNKIEKAKAKARAQEAKRQLPVAPPSDGDTIDRSEFPPAEVIPMGIPFEPDEDGDEGKHDGDKPETGIFVIQDEVDIDEGETLKPVPGRDLPEPETFDPTPQGVVPSVSGVEEPDVVQDWIDNWRNRFPGPDEDPADYSDDFDDLHPVVNHPSADVHEPHTWRPIQAIDQNDTPFFIPSVVGEDPLQPSMQQPEAQRMVDPLDEPDEPVNLWM